MSRLNGAMAARMSGNVNENNEEIPNKSTAKTVDHGMEIKKKYKEMVEVYNKDKTEVREEEVECKQYEFDSRKKWPQCAEM